ncbi:glycoside hydrolase family 65 protein [Nocardiopsis ansamitocini]|uniref:Family 65 glycosyl hydrolase n=1 Tax=Nocardiopsis ansamitocini TaxID=1670832 RepID=A0A9W6P9K4_9ACTN|nr:glycosyl hydrolase family 65 protein [Nocardiopsis ansamitocini]GLU49527.1 family 65 glycosyl hydrolase [Nocardiopsis ansamitocini]
MDHWRLTYSGFDPAAEGVREALCTLANGYLATRGAAAESHADGTHYPGTYVAGCYDRLTSTVGGHEVENEDIVNVPNWLPFTFRADGGDWLGGGGNFVEEDERELDMRSGVLIRTGVVRDRGGRRTRFEQRRLVSMDSPHVVALRTVIVPQNWTGTLTVRSGLDGRVVNAGVARYRGLDRTHLRPAGSGRHSPGLMWLRSRTVSSGIDIALAARTTVTQGPAPTVTWPDSPDGLIQQDLEVEARASRGVTVEKVVAIHTSRDTAISDCLTEALENVSLAEGFDELSHRHHAAWGRLWWASSVDIGNEEDQRLLNLHQFHLLQTLSPHTADLDVGVPARGLHGEAYRGHVFWDELFVFPFLTTRFPETARALLRYRWRRLPQARAAAHAAGHRGAMFPWQSGSDGREEAQRLHVNPRSKRWIPDNSHLQRHVNIAIAHNVWQHYQVTGETSFLVDFGAELLLETARLLASLASLDTDLGRYVIRGVMGPDEYHDGYPDRDTAGVDDNAYTNVMTVWVLRRALDTLAALPGRGRAELLEQLEVAPEELDRFEDICTRMRVPFHDGVISQFAGYESLAELDWPGYRKTYGDIRRLDRILEAEGDSCNRYKASKQADVLMLFFLLPAEELAELLEDLGYPYDPGLIPRTVDYYMARTCHGSTLSSVVHSWVVARTDRHASWEFFLDALRCDFDDVQGGTTSEGIHLGSMAGTVDLLTRCYTGLVARNESLQLSPLVPAELDGLSFTLRYRGHWGMRLDFFDERVGIEMPDDRAPPVTVELKGQKVRVSAGRTCALPSAPGQTDT